MAGELGLGLGLRKERGLQREGGEARDAHQVAGVEEGAITETGVEDGARRGRSRRRMRDKKNWQPDGVVGELLWVVARPGALSVAAPGTDSTLFVPG